jgi:hypothetical protein
VKRNILPCEADSLVELSSRISLGIRSDVAVNELYQRLRERRDLALWRILAMDRLEHDVD